jgi:hypothetical protein
MKSNKTLIFIFLLKMKEWLLFYATSNLLQRLLNVFLAYVELFVEKDPQI